jgi:hypothetical protein
MTVMTMMTMMVMRDNHLCFVDYTSRNLQLHEGVTFLFATENATVVCIIKGLMITMMSCSLVYHCYHL